MNILHGLSCLDGDVAISMALVWGGSVWALGFQVWAAYLDVPAPEAPSPEPADEPEQPAFMVWWTPEDHAAATEPVGPEALDARHGGHPAEAAA